MRRLVLFMGFLALPVLSADDRDQVKGLWASDGSIFSVYEETGNLHGEIIALKDPVYTPTEDPERVGILGIGRELVQRAAASLRERGISVVHVDFKPEHAQFYERCGFRRSSAAILELGE